MGIWYGELAMEPAVEYHFGPNQADFLQPGRGRSQIGPFGRAAADAGWAPRLCNLRLGRKSPACIGSSVTMVVLETALRPGRSRWAAPRSFGRSDPGRGLG